MVYNLTAEGIGQSTAIGVDGDPFVKLYCQELLELFGQDPNSIALIG